MRFAVASLGCKTNQYEMDALSQKLVEGGLAPAVSGEQADFYILNTCAVTAEAERKSRQLLRRFRRQNPRAFIVACGCFSQRSDLTAYADLVIGTSRRDQLPGLIMAAVETRPDAPVCYVQPSLEDAEYEELGATAVPEETRAYLKIQDGCDNRCAYCAICLARGPARSRAMERILEEAGDLAARGFSELVLTGTNINAYGVDFPDDGKVRDLADVVAALDTVAGIGRIRLGSLESGIITPRFMERISKLRHLCPSFHLSLQSGSDRILRAMKRRDSTGQYRSAVDLIRSSFPDAGITTDLIVGFPGESDGDFEKTLAFCDDIQFLRIHVFRFSPRSGTAAAAMPGQVPEDVAVSRSRILRKKGADLALNAIRNRMGKTYDVLVEQVDQDGRALGYTPEYLQVKGISRGMGEGPPRRGQIRAMRLCGMEGAAARALVL